MSIFSKIVRGIVGAGTGFLTGGPLGAVVGGATALGPAPRAQPGAGFVPQPVSTAFVGSALTQVRGMRLPAVPRAPGLPPAAPGVPLPFPSFGDAAGAACPVGFHLDKRTRSHCVRNRRMNPLNGKAASRAIRRIKGARKMLQKIERQLPKVRTRAVPRHGHRTTVEAT